MLPLGDRTVLHILDAVQVLRFRERGGVTEARRLSFRALDVELHSWMERIDDALEPVDTFMAREGLATAWAERESFLHRSGNMAGAPPIA